MDDRDPGNGTLAATTRRLERRMLGICSDTMQVAPIRCGNFAFAACLALLLAACAPQPTAAHSPTVKVGADSASACPLENFDAYIERFGREIAFQELTTADPLIIERYDTAAEPEPRSVVEKLALADVVWPVMPRLDLISGSGRTYDITPIAGDRMDVQVSTPDTSDQQRYVFKQSPCWQLQRVIDESI